MYKQVYSVVLCMAVLPNASFDQLIFMVVHLYNLIYNI